MGELSGSLLQVLTPEGLHLERKGIPVMLEFPVNSSLSPFLVSSSKALLWVGCHNNRVKAASRKVSDIQGFFWEVTEAIIKEGQDAGWGNIQPLTAIGVKAAIRHVKEYGLVDLEILANPDTPWGEIDLEWAVTKGEIPMALLGFPIQPAPWVQPNTIIVVPKDRAYVGFVVLFAGHITSVTHNASRGIGVATSWEPQGEE